MELREVRIKCFKSVKDEIKILVDPRVTIFIGANDHGKSNLLEAIRCLNDDRPITQEDVHWDKPDEEPVRIEWHFQCSKEVISSMKEKLKEQTDEKADDVASTEEAAQAEPATAETPAVTEEAKAPEATEEELLPSNKEKMLVLYREGVNNPVKILSAPLDIPSSKESLIIATKPRVEWFESPNIELKDETTLEQLEGEQDFEFMQGIFRHAGIWEDRKEIFTINDQTTRKLDEASKRLTKVLNTTWNQGKDLIWHLKHDEGSKIAIKIQDQSISSRYTRPSLKSSGFRTYFLLSMITFARTKNNPSKYYIYLFDEPGTNLHPRAQIDLQRSLEALSDDTQILYTTHSLFLINKNHPDRNMVVTKTQEGTKINLKPFQKNWKAVRESLGILLSNNFLIAEKTVLVEGPSDLIYLLHAIRTLKSLGKIDIDLNDLSIVDAGDESNYVAFAKLMLHEGRNVFALLDGDSSGDKNKSRLEKACAKEITGKQLEILQLDHGKSSENVMADLEELKKSILAVTSELIKNKERKLKDGIEPEKEVEKITVSEKKTLGKVIDEATTTWFEPEEKLSKLSVALTYEDLADPAKATKGAEKLVKDIDKALSLRSEKAYEKGVFEEAGK